MGAKIDSEAEPKVLGVLQEEAEHAASLREGALVSRVNSSRNANVWQEPRHKDIG